MWTKAKIRREDPVPTLGNCNSSNLKEMGCREVETEWNEKTNRKRTARERTRALYLLGIKVTGSRCFSKEDHSKEKEKGGGENRQLERWRDEGAWKKEKWKTKSLNKQREEHRERRRTKRNYEKREWWEVQRFHQKVLQKRRREKAARNSWQLATALVGMLAAQTS